MQEDTRMNNLKYIYNLNESISTTLAFTFLFLFCLFTDLKVSRLQKFCAPNVFVKTLLHFLLLLQIFLKLFFLYVSLWKKIKNISNILIVSSNMRHYCACRQTHVYKHTEKEHFPGSLGSVH